MASNRPRVNAYEADAYGVERLVYRPMTDEEYAQHLADVEAFSTIDPPKSALRRALEQLDPDAPLTAATLLELETL